MNNKTKFLAALLLLYSTVLSAQVQVSKEPLHKKVLENKYIRLLDVWMKPGDTSMFHIHSTPSVFLIFTNTATISKIKGADWEKGQNTAGHSWYRSFFQDTLIHRVGNADTVPFHVTDIELLSAYKPNEKREALPFPLLYENEQVFAYKLTASSFPTKVISGRGPIVAEVVSGGEIICDILKRDNYTKLKNGGYIYLPPGSTFYFSAYGKEDAMLVLFEIK
jgi:hypothetical protein